MWSGVFWQTAAWPSIWVFVDFQSLLVPLPVVVTLTVTLTYGGFTILTTTVTAGTHTEVFPGVFITANGTKIVSITLEDFNITSNNMTLDVYEQAATSAQFLVTGQIEKSTTE